MTPERLDNSARRIIAMRRACKAPVPRFVLLDEDGLYFASYDSPSEESALREEWKDVGKGKLHKVETDGL